jgi:DNA invertase Pin-like site-specific DNA recombinase
MRVAIYLRQSQDRTGEQLGIDRQRLERCQKTGTAIVTAADGVDTSTDGGRLVARILSSVAQGEVERKAARQQSAAQQAAKQGRGSGADVRSGMRQTG